MKIVVDGETPFSCYRCDFRSGTGFANLCGISGQEVAIDTDDRPGDCPIRPRSEVDSDEILNIILGGDGE